MVQFSKCKVLEKAGKEIYQIRKSKFSYIQKQNVEFCVLAELSHPCYIYDIEYMRFLSIKMTK